MTWFRRKTDAAEEREKRETTERVRAVKERAERVTHALGNRKSRNHFTEALTALMKGH